MSRRKEDEIRHFLRLGVSKNAIAKFTGVSSRPCINSSTPRVSGARIIVRNYKNRADRHLRYAS